MKNCQHILLLLLIPHLLMLLAEAAVSLVLVRRWSYVRNSYLSRPSRRLLECTSTCANGGGALAVFGGGAIFLCCVS